MHKTKLFRGIVATLAFVLVVLIVATSMTITYKTTIDDYLSTGTTTSTSTDEDLVYYESEFGEFNDVNIEKLYEATYNQTVQEMEEGAVLLKNEDSALPLEEDERSITIFGASSVNPVIKNNSAGNTASGEYLVTMGQAFEAKDFEINDTLWAAYGGEVTTKVQDLTRERNEMPSSFYTSDIKSSWADEYNDVAIIFIARESAEGNDFSMNDEDGISQLALHENEEDLIKMVTSDDSFDKVIAILNVPTSMEVGWLDEYDIDACLWIGAPGQSGFVGMVNILIGDANPSGHLVDVYATDSLSAPAVVNSGTNSLQWSNLSEMRSGITTESNASYYSYYTPQLEGIYIGYKYYETRYEDLILGNRNADSTKGSSTGNAWDYTDEVSYTFGYGLSYTEFVQTLKDVEKNEDGTYTVTVNVRNDGDTPGKSVVQVYAQTPYGKYEEDNLVEKSSIQIVGFAKTDILDPEEDIDVEVVVDEYLLASYDYVKEEGYILSAGTYYLAIGDNAHDALNNILAEKDYTTDDGMDYNGNSEKVYSWDLEELDATTYDESVTGYEVTNQFEDCDLNHWIEDSVTYLTRQDWNTYPDKLEAVEATDELIEALNGETYTQPADSPAVSSFTFGADNDIALIDMKGLSLDDEKWEDYLDQMTLTELAGQLVQTIPTIGEVSSVGKPATPMGDGMDSIGGNYAYGDGRPTSNYTSTVTLACTWNVELYERRGELLGEEALWRDNNTYTLYSVGGNLHRTPFAGRNFEYISEDATMCALISQYVVKGVQSTGCNAAMKHMTNNDQELYRTGVATFFNEQAFREASLRIYEYAVVKYDLRNMMTGLNRLGPTYCTQSYALLTVVLRYEWGFEGSVTSDAASATYVNVAECLAAGLDTFCGDYSSVSSTKAQRLVNNGDGNILELLRQAVKRTHYCTVNSIAMNGVGRTVEAAGLSWWQYTIYAIDAVVAIGLLCSLFFYTNSKYGFIDKYKKSKGSEAGGNE